VLLLRQSVEKLEADVRRLQAENSKLLAENTRLVRSCLSKNPRAAARC